MRVPYVERKEVVGSSSRCRYCRSTAGAMLATILDKGPSKLAVTHPHQHTKHIPMLPPGRRLLCHPRQRPEGPQENVRGGRGRPVGGLLLVPLCRRGGQAPEAGGCWRPTRGGKYTGPAPGACIDAAGGSWRCGGVCLHLMPSAFPCITPQILSPTSRCQLPSTVHRRSGCLRAAAMQLTGRAGPCELAL